MDSYVALRMIKTLSFNPFTVGSDLRLDRTYLRRSIEEMLRSMIGRTSIAASAALAGPAQGR